MWRIQACSKLHYPEGKKNPCVIRELKRYSEKKKKMNEEEREKKGARNKINKYADIEIFFSHRSCNRGLWNIWPKYQREIQEARDKFHVLWNKRNISWTQMAERTIMLYYSSTYHSTFVLTYKARSSVSFFHNPSESNVDTTSEEIFLIH